MSGSVDLTTIPAVQAYLQNTPFASNTITALSGGTANYAYRIHLATPVDGQSTLVLKHAQPYVKNLASIAFDVYRQVYEVEALTRIKSWLPADTIVTVPKVHLFDRQSNVIILEDCGEDSLTLKEFLRQGRASSSLAEQMGTSIGLFLSALHQWGKQDPDDILELFRGNQQAKSISAWATYGRLAQTLNGQDKLSALSNRPVITDEQELEAVSRIASEMSLAINSASEFFVMGDFWPGNMMVVVDGDQLRRIYVLDWELAKAGVPGVEIGQFCAEMQLLRRFEPKAKDAASRILSTFLSTYSRVCHPEVRVCRDALVHLGSHLVVLTPRIPWGDEASTRAVVEEGAQLLLGASSEGEEWLKDSIISPLFTRE